MSIRRNKISPKFVLERWVISSAPDKFWNIMIHSNFIRSIFVIKLNLKNWNLILKNLRCVQYSLLCKTSGIYCFSSFFQVTVLQDSQYAALRNKYWSLNFLQILIVFATKIANFVNLRLCFFKKRPKWWLLLRLKIT